MSYRCGLCNHQSEQGQPRKVYRTYRIKKGLRYIDRETPICTACEIALRNGWTVREMIALCQPVNH